MVLRERRALSLWAQPTKSCLRKSAFPPQPGNKTIQNRESVPAQPIAEPTAEPSLCSKPGLDGTGGTAEESNQEFRSGHSDPSSLVDSEFDFLYPQSLRARLKNINAHFKGPAHLQDSHVNKKKKLTLPPWERRIISFCYYWLRY